MLANHLKSWECQKNQGCRRIKEERNHLNHWEHHQWSEIVGWKFEEKMLLIEGWGGWIWRNTWGNREKALKKQATIKGIRGAFRQTPEKTEYVRDPIWWRKIQESKAFWG